ncbi:MAG: D-alanine--D-alanine ligase [Chitinophagaceae bacterium]
MKKKIALLAGGYSGEREISIKTARTIEQHIDANRYEVHKIIIDRDRWYAERDGQTVNLNRFSITQADGQEIRFDAAFIAVHGTPGEDGKLQGYLDMQGIPYTSCSAIVSGLTFNKLFCNQVVAQGGLVHVAKSLGAYRHRPYSTQEIINQLGLPVFVKPAEGGSSLATTKVKTEAELEPALQAVFAIEEQAMVESFIPGREFSIGVYRIGQELHTLPPTEIISTKEFFDYEAKYTPGVTREVTPADITPEQAKDLAQKAAAIYNHLNCKGICRVDFILSNTNGAWYFLEINTVPGQSENSIVPQQVRAAGKTLQDFYGALLEECLAC